MTPAGIEPVTFWFVAQHLNHCATAVPWRRNKHLLMLQNMCTLLALYDLCKKHCDQFIIHIMDTCILWHTKAHVNSLNIIRFVRYQVLNDYLMCDWHSFTYRSWLQYSQPGAAFEGGKWGDRPSPRYWGGLVLQAYELVKLYSDTAANEDNSSRNHIR